MSFARRWARFRGFLYRVKYEWLLGKAEMAGPLYVHVGLEIRGRGKVYFGSGCCIRPSVFGSEPVSFYFKGRGGEVRVGDGALFRGTRIGCQTLVVIGAGAVIEDASLFDTDFHNLDARKRDVLDAGSSRPLVLGEGVYVGHECLLGKGTAAGAGAVFLPRTVLSWKPVPPGAVVAGIPGRPMPPAAGMRDSAPFPAAAVALETEN